MGQCWAVKKAHVAVCESFVLIITAVFKIPTNIWISGFLTSFEVMDHLENLLKTLDPTPQKSAYTHSTMYSFK